MYIHPKWDKEVTVTMTVKQLFILQQCAESIIWKGEMCDFIVGVYEDIEPGYLEQIVEAQKVLIDKWHKEKN